MSGPDMLAPWHVSCCARCPSFPCHSVEQRKFQYSSMSFSLLMTSAHTGMRGCIGVPRSSQCPQLLPVVGIVGGPRAQDRALGDEQLISHPSERADHIHVRGVFGPISILSRRRLGRKDDHRGSERCCGCRFPALPVDASCRGRAWLLCPRHPRPLLFLSSSSLPLSRSVQLAHIATALE